MKKLYGIWIDHAGAYVVKANEEDVQSVTHVSSGVNSNHHSGETGERLTMSDPLSDDNKRHEQMHKFAKEILEMVKDADEIAICGPSTAKYDLRREYEKKLDVAKKIVAFESADKMTENQLKAYIKELLGVPREEW